MTRILVLASLAVLAAGTLATLSVRQSAEILAAAAVVGGFGAAIVVVRRWLTRGCDARPTAESHRNVTSDADVTADRRAV